MSDKKYPYIGEAKITGVKVLFFCDGEGITIDGESYEIGSHRKNWSEPAFRNITREYLTNTYGEVKDERHAEFIKALAEANGIEMTIGRQPVTPKTFAFHSDNGRLSFYALTMRELNLVDLKQITIPQPPEDWNMEHYTKQEEEFEMAQRNMAAKENRTLQENGDNLMFGGEDRCKEWPCVGSSVQTSLGKGIIALDKDKHGYYIVDIDSVYHQVQLGQLQKPKTPEEELRDDICNTLLNDVYHGQYDEQSFWPLAGALMKKYNITKKPQ